MPPWIWFAWLCGSGAERGWRVRFRWPAIVVDLVDAVSQADDLSREVYCILGMPIDAVEMPDVLRRIEGAARAGEPFVISTPNLNFLISSQSDPEFRESVLLSDLCATDGTPIIWLARIMGIPITNRIAGSDIFEALKTKRKPSRALKVFLFGGAEGVASAASKTLNDTRGGLRCVGLIQPGFGSIDEMSRSDLIDEVNSSHADMLVASLGAKKGQLWLLRNHRDLRIPVRAHLGATLNFQAGTVKRAPMTFRRLGLEWLWRIKEEPHLWTRYAHDGGVLLRLLVTNVLPLKILGAWSLARSHGTNKDLIIGETESADTITVNLSGGATASQAHKAISVLLKALRRPGKNVIINLSDVCHVDARFLGLLLMLRKCLKEEDRSLQLTGAGPRLARLFRLNGVGFLLVGVTEGRVMSVQSVTLNPTRTPPLVLVAAVVAGLVCLAAFSRPLMELVHRWSLQEEYSHGFLIPLVTAWMLWGRRAATLASIGRPSWTGPCLILLAMGMHLIGELSALFLFSQLGFVVALLGITLSVGGWSLFRVTFVPILFLLFAIPLPYFIDAALTLRLQLISSQLGTFFIRMFQIPVYLDGNIIDLGYYKLQVVEACSGLRYLYPLLSLGFLAAYLFRAPLWQRAVVFLSAIPITIIMNGFRIGMVGVTVDRWGIEMADDALHFFEGWIIFLACSGVLAAEMLLFARFSGKAMYQVFDLPTGQASLPVGSGFKTRAALLPVLASLFLLSAAGFAISFISGRTEIVPERARFASFPSRIGGWQGRASLLDSATEQGLGLDDYILSDYSKSDGKPVNLYVAYYSSQRSGESPHSPIVCIPGGGWLITKLERTSYPDLGTGLPFNRVVIEKDGIKELVYYWFDERGRKIANEYWSKWYLLADAITKNRTDGSLVRLSTSISPGEPERDADERLKSFMRDVVPNLAQYLPSDGGQEVKSVLSTPVGNHS